MKELNHNYDQENDVMYINFYWPPREADYSHKTGDCIIRVKNHEIIGITILNYRGSGEKTNE